MNKEITISMTLEGNYITLTAERTDKVSDIIQAAIARLKITYSVEIFVCYISGSLHLKKVMLSSSIDNLVPAEVNRLSMWVVLRENDSGEYGINPYGSRHFFNSP